MRARQDFNFIVRDERPAAWSWSLLALGAVALALVADGFAVASDKNAELLRQSERLERKGKVAVGSKRNAEMEKSVVAVRRDMTNFAWDSHLVELELALGERVGVLGLDTEAAAQRTRLTGEARGIEDALALLGRLRESPLVRDAYLVAHEAKRDASFPVVTFVLQIDWRTD